MYRNIFDRGNLLWLIKYVKGNDNKIEDTEERGDLLSALFLIESIVRSVFSLAFFSLFPSCTAAMSSSVSFCLLAWVSVYVCVCVCRVSFVDVGNEGRKRQ